MTCSFPIFRIFNSSELHVRGKRSRARPSDADAIRQGLRRENLNPVGNPKDALRKGLNKRPVSRRRDLFEVGSRVDRTVTERERERKEFREISKKVFASLIPSYFLRWSCLFPALALRKWRETFEHLSSDGTRTRANDGNLRITVDREEEKREKEERGNGGTDRSLRLLNQSSTV